MSERRPHSHQSPAPGTGGVSDPRRSSSSSSSHSTGMNAQQRQALPTPRPSSSFAPRPSSPASSKTASSRNATKPRRVPYTNKASGTLHRTSKAVQDHRTGRREAIEREQIEYDAQLRDSIRRQHNAKPGNTFIPHDPHFSREPIPSSLHPDAPESKRQRSVEHARELLKQPGFKLPESELKAYRRRLLEESYSYPHTVTGRLRAMAAEQKTPHTSYNTTDPDLVRSLLPKKSPKEYLQEQRKEIASQIRHHGRALRIDVVTPEDAEDPLYSPVANRAKLMTERGKPKYNKDGLPYELNFPHAPRDVVENIAKIYSTHEQFRTLESHKTKHPEYNALEHGMKPEYMRAELLADALADDPAVLEDIEKDKAITSRIGNKLYVPSEPIPLYSSSIKRLDPNTTDYDILQLNLRRNGVFSDEDMDRLFLQSGKGHYIDENGHRQLNEEGKKRLKRLEEYRRHPATGGMLPDDDDYFYDSEMDIFSTDKGQKLLEEARRQNSRRSLDYGYNNMKHRQRSPIHQKRFSTTQYTHIAKDHLKESESTLTPKQKDMSQHIKDETFNKAVKWDTVMQSQDKMIKRLSEASRPKRTSSYQNPMSFIHDRDLELNETPDETQRRYNMSGYLMNRDAAHRQRRVWEYVDAFKPRTLPEMMQQIDHKEWDKPRPTLDYFVQRYMERNDINLPSVEILRDITANSWPPTDIIRVDTTVDYRSIARPEFLWQDNRAITKFNIIDLPTKIGDECWSNPANFEKADLDLHPEPDLTTLSYSLLHPKSSLQIKIEEVSGRQRTPLYENVDEYGKPIRVNKFQDAVDALDNADIKNGFAPSREEQERTQRKQQEYKDNIAKRKSKSFIPHLTDDKEQSVLGDKPMTPEAMLNKLYSSKPRESRSPTTLLVLESNQTVYDILYGTVDNTKAYNDVYPLLTWLEPSQAQAVQAIIDMAKSKVLLPDTFKGNDGQRHLPHTTRQVLEEHARIYNKDEWDIATQHLKKVSEEYENQYNNLLNDDDTTTTSSSNNDDDDNYYKHPYHINIHSRSDPHRHQERLTDEQKFTRLLKRQHPVGQAYNESNMLDIFESYPNQPKRSFHPYTNNKRQEYNQKHAIREIRQDFKRYYSWLPWKFFKKEKKRSKQHSVKTPHLNYYSENYSSPFVKWLRQSDSSINERSEDSRMRRRMIDHKEGMFYKDDFPSH